MKASITPLTVFPRHPLDQFSEAACGARAAWLSNLGGIILPSNQSPMPSQERVGRDDAGRAAESLAPHGLRLESQAASLVIVEPGTPSQLLLQNTHFLLKVFDDYLLVTIHPTCNAGHDQSERSHGQIIH